MDQQNGQSHKDVVTLLAWQAPGRPYVTHGKQYFATILLFFLFSEIILFLFHQYAFMLLVLSLVFVTFSLAIVPPTNFHYRISSQGITIEDHFFLWQELYDFYFKKRYDTDILHIRTQSLIPGELTLTLGPTTKAHMKSVLLPYLPYREVVKPTFLEKWGDRLSKTFPLEAPTSETTK